MDEQLEKMFDDLVETTGQVLGDICDTGQGTLKDEDRPAGVCMACEKFADEAMIHESPGTAGCCQDCDAYEGGSGSEEEVKNV